MDKDALRIYKSKLIDVLISFDNICIRHGLNYYACSGTAIGAIRHKGIIPWDDDIDVLMPRDDYRKLVEVTSENDNGRYKLAKLGDEGYIYPFGKYYDSLTTLIEHKEYPSCILGVFIDVFPVDEVAGPIEEIRTKKSEYNKRFQSFQNTYLKLNWHYIASCLYHMRIGRLTEIILCSIIPSKKDRLRKNFVEYEEKWSQEIGNWLMVHHAEYSLEKELLDPSWFESYFYVPFDNYKIRVCKGYDLYLKKMHGDYMTPPPVELQKTRHYHYYLNLKEGLDIDSVKERIRHGERILF